MGIKEKELRDQEDLAKLAKDFLPVAKCKGKQRWYVKGYLCPYCGSDIPEEKCLIQPKIDSEVHY